jgi:hypothetical protein
MSTRDLALLMLLSGALIACPSPVTPRTVDGPPTSDLVQWLSTPSDADDARKRFAATLLGLRDDPDGLAALHDAVLRDRSPSVRAAAVDALGVMTRPGVGTLLQASTDRAPIVRRAALRALGRFDSGVDGLRRRAQERSDEGRLATLALASRGVASLDLNAPDRFEEPERVLETKPGRIWYVDATAGDDAASGDVGTPLLTVGRAIGSMKPGDWVHATSGDDSVAFREHILFPYDKSGTLRSPTVLAAWPGRPPPVLDGFVEGNPKPGPGIGIQVEADYVRIEGWTVRGFDESGIHLGGAWDAAVNCTVERCERHGIFAYYAPHATIVGATVRDCAAQGISLRSSPFAVVSGSSSHDNGIDGLLLLEDSDDVTVVDFTASGNQRGIGLMGRSNGARLIHVDVRGNHGEAVGFNADCDVVEFGVRRE